MEINHLLQLNVLHNYVVAQMRCLYIYFCYSIFKTDRLSESLTIFFQIETEALRSQLSNHVHTKNNLNNLKKENENLTSKLDA